jgi:integrase
MYLTGRQSSKGVKAMGKTKRELSWFGPRKGYKKMIRGKMYYFALGECKSESDTEGYYKAIKEYVALRDKLDKQEAREVETLIQAGKLPNGSTAELTLTSKLTNWASLESATRGDTAARELHQTIDGLIAVYLERRKRLADSHQIELKTYTVEKYLLANWLSFCHYKGKSSLPETLSPEFLGDYRDKLFTALAKGQASDSHVHNNLRILKACLQWAYDEEYIPALPRKIRDYARVKMESPKPLFYTVDEVKTLYNRASERTRLYILLGLNLGYTQVDIATLEHSMIDWQQGTITRQRHKTGQDQTAKLWPITQELLRKHATDSKQGLALIGEGGNPLIVERINADGNPIKIDAIALAYNRLTKKTGINGGRSFKTWRKVGADQIAKQFQDSPHLIDRYLGHSEKTVRKHYANNHFDELFKATDWLATVWGFDSIKAGDKLPETKPEATEGKPGAEAEGKPETSKPKTRKTRKSK